MRWVSWTRLHVAGYLEGTKHADTLRAPQKRNERRQPLRRRRSSVKWGKLNREEGARPSVFPGSWGSHAASQPGPRRPLLRRGGRARTAVCAAVGTRQGRRIRTLHPSAIRITDVPKRVRSAHASRSLREREPTGIGAT